MPRPILVNGSRRTTVITPRITREEHERAKQAAARCGRSLNEFCVNAINAATCAVLGPIVEQAEPGNAA